MRGEREEREKKERRREKREKEREREQGERERERERKRAKREKKMQKKNTKRERRNKEKKKKTKEKKHTCVIALKFLHCDFRTRVHVNLEVTIEDIEEGGDEKNTVAMDMLPRVAGHHQVVLVRGFPVIRLLFQLEKVHTKVHTKVVLQLKKSDGSKFQRVQMGCHHLQ